MRPVVSGLLAVLLGGLSACSDPQGGELIPAQARIAVLVRPEAMLRSQLRPRQLLSPAFWRQMREQRARQGSRLWNGQLILGTFWAFNVDAVPGHWYFLYPTPEQTHFEGMNPSFRSRPMEGQPYTIGVFNPAGDVSPAAFSYLISVAGGQEPVWHMPGDVRAAIREGSHLLVYSSDAPAPPGKAGALADSSLFTGRGLASVYFADGVARGKVRFYPGPANRLRGHPLLARSVSLRPCAGGARGKPG